MGAGRGDSIRFKADTAHVTAIRGRNADEYGNLYGDSRISD